MFPQNAVLRSDSEQEEEREDDIGEVEKYKIEKVDESCEESFLKIPDDLRQFWPFLFTNFPKETSSGTNEVDVRKFTGRDQNIEELIFKSNNGFVCRLCQNQFRKITPILRHMKITHGIRRPYICRHCGRRIRDYSTLYHHAKGHAKKKAGARDMFSLEDYLASTFDSFLTSRQISASNPAITKNAEEQYACVVCDAAFEKILPAFSHLQEAHLFTSPYMCFACNTTCKSMPNLYSHCLLAHSNATPPYKCELCEKTFYYQSVLKDHVISHTGATIKPYVCGVCSKAFTRKRDRTRHLRSIHNGEGRIVCHFCGKVCTSEWNLNQHMKIHGIQGNSHEDVFSSDV